MPRLIAIDGPATGVALPIAGPESYLGEGPGRSVRLVRGGPPPSGGAAIRVVAPREGGPYRIARLGPNAPALAVNGEAVEAAALQHGDLVTLAGTTLIFDCDDHAASETSRPEAGDVRLAAIEPLPAPAKASDPGALREGRAGEEDSSSPATGAIRYRQKAVDDPGALYRTVEAKDPAARRLATLLRIGAAIGATLDLPALLEALLDSIFEEVPADRGTILLLDRETKKLRSMATRSRLAPGAAGGEEGPQVSRTIIKEALRARESILTLDAMADARFRLGESVHAAHIRSAMCVPIVRSGRVLGVIQVDTVEQARAFSREDLDLLTAIASLAALAIENAKLFQEAAERERLRSELALASAIQRRLLPKAQPGTPDLDVFGTMVPAKELGGDYFDFVEDGANLDVFVGDVSGKGAGAALIMAMARSYFRPLARMYASPRTVLAEVNRLLYGDTDRETFMSAVHLRWNGQAKRLVYAGAGQEHLVLIAASGVVEATPAGGVALGLVDEAAPYLEDRELPLAPGEAVLLYSDGVTEARAPDGEFFGLERLLRLLREIGPSAGARAIVERVVAAVCAWQGAGDRHDDITVVVLKRRS